MRRASFLLAILATLSQTGANAASGTLPFAPSPAGFASALSAREFAFPGDHGPHPEFAHEWWYVTGHLATPDGRKFGFELTFFRVALAPPQAASQAPGGSRWRTRQIYVAHFAVTDIDEGRFTSFERFGRDALGLAGAERDPVRVWLADWSLGAAGAAWHLEAAQGSYALALDMKPLLPPVLNGDRGLSQKSDAPADASYYYSIPRLKVHGRLQRDGRSFDVAGTAWLDREWGSGALSKEQSGWDWFALQLSDGSTLMFYSLRRRDGGRDAHSAGTFVAEDGRVRPLTADEVSIKVQSLWQSPRGGRYPARWRLEVPALGLVLTLKPVLADQELATTPRYWEGVVAVTGTRAEKPVLGQGYTELVGYAR